MFILYSTSASELSDSFSISVGKGLKIQFSTILIFLPFSAAIAQNHISSAVGQSFANKSSLNISLYRDFGGYKTPPFPVKKFKTDVLGSVCGVQFLYGRILFSESKHILLTL